MTTTTEPLPPLLERSNEASASHMLWVLLVFAWGLATVVTVSGLLGNGTTISLYLAIGWWVLTSSVLLTWSRLELHGKKILCLLILLLLLLRWGYSWLFAPPQDTMIGLVIGLLYTPVIMTIATILFSGNSRLLCISVGTVMGLVAIAGSSREALAVTHLDDWRIGPLVLCVYTLFAWLLGNWIREREALESSMRRAAGLQAAANTDPLTGVFNRRAADAFLNKNRTSQRRWGVIFLDLDHFKRINDNFGHDTGDRVLAKVAALLRSRLRESDLVARWGGEEFVILLESISAEETAKIAEDLRHLIEQLQDDNIPTITASLGAAHADNGASLVAGIKAADQALYRAKNGGRNQVVADWVLSERAT